MVQRYALQNNLIKTYVGIYASAESANEDAINDRYFHEAVPFDPWISSSCSATMIQESASKEESEPFSFKKDSMDDVNMSGVHCTSGAMPTWSMSWSAGDKYFATVIKRADPSCSSVTLCNCKGKYNKIDGMLQNQLSSLYPHIKITSELNARMRLQLHVPQLAFGF